MANESLNSKPTSHTAILAILAGLLEGNVAAYEALDQLTMLRAEPWLIDSVRKIEDMFAPRDCDYCGPMDETVRKIRGAA